MLIVAGILVAVLALLVSRLSSSDGRALDASLRHHERLEWQQGWTGGVSHTGRWNREGR